MIGRSERSREVAQVLNTILISAKRRDELLKDTDLVIRSGRYSPREIREVEAAVSDFLRENNLRIESLHEYVTYASKDFPFKDLAVQVASTTKHRSLFSVYLFIHYRYHPSFSKMWTLSSDVELLEHVKNHGRRWVLIAREMNKAQRYIRSKYFDLIEERMKPEHIRKLCKGYGIEVSSEAIEEFRKWPQRTLIQRVEAFASRRALAAWSSEAEIELCSYVLYLNYYADESFKSLLAGGECEHSEFFGLKIEAEDVFWSNIKKKMRLPARFVTARFKVIQKTNGIKTFGDLVAHIFRLRDAADMQSRRNALVSELRAGSTSQKT